MVWKDIRHLLKDRKTQSLFFLYFAPPAPPGDCGKRRELLRHCAHHALSTDFARPVSDYHVERKTAFRKLSNFFIVARTFVEFPVDLFRRNFAKSSHLSPPRFELSDYNGHHPSLAAPLSRPRRPPSAAADVLKVSPELVAALRPASVESRLSLIESTVLVSFPSRSRRAAVVCFNCAIDHDSPLVSEGQ